MSIIKFNMKVLLERWLERNQKSHEQELGLAKGKDVFWEMAIEGES